MSEQKTPALHIGRRHQSAPAEHFVDKEIRKAAEEIDRGNYIPELAEGSDHPDLNIALGLGTDRVAMGEKPTLEDFQRTHELNQLGQHPRVIEALEKLKQESEDGKTPEELEERAMAMHDLMAMQSAKDKWEGQSRWEGKENEEKRKGELLTPWQFYDRLTAVIGSGRVFLSPHFIPSLQNPKSGRMGLYVPNPKYDGDAFIKKTYLQERAAELRDEGLTKLKTARQLRANGQNAKADKMFHEAGSLAQAATEMLMQMNMDDQLAEPPVLRVGSLQAPLGTEWMIMQFDRYGVPVEAKFLGWRTALLTMIRCKAITETEAHTAFPVRGGLDVSDHYMKQLYLLRNQEQKVN